MLQRIQSETETIQMLLFPDGDSVPCVSVQIQRFLLCVLLVQPLLSLLCQLQV